jgi:lipopolysaccharide transport system ATP-binding protein
MSSNDIAIRVEDVSMRFELYDAPRDQLKQFVLPRLQRMTGLKSSQYFREFWALKDISFEVKKASLLALSVVTVVARVPCCKSSQVR